MKKILILTFLFIIGTGYVFAINFEISEKTAFEDVYIKNDIKKEVKQERDPNCIGDCLMLASNKYLNNNAFTYQEVCKSDKNNLFIEFDYLKYKTPIIGNTLIHKNGNNLYYATIGSDLISKNEYYDIFEYDCNKQKLKNIGMLSGIIESVQILSNTNSVFAIVNKSDGALSSSSSVNYSTTIIEYNKLNLSKKEYQIFKYPLYPLVVENIGKRSFVEIKSDLKGMFSIFVEFLKYSLKNNGPEHKKEIKERKIRNLYNAKDYLYSILYTQLLGNKITIESINDEGIGNITFLFTIGNPVNTKSFKMYSLKTTIDLNNKKIGF